jgi:hypothetical protein
MIEFRVYEENHVWDGPPTGIEVAMYIRHLCEHLWKPVRVDPMLIHEWMPEVLLVTYLRLAVNGKTPIDPVDARLRVAGEILHRRTTEFQEGYDIEAVEQLRGVGIAAKVVHYEECLRGRLYDFINDWCRTIGYFVDEMKEEPPNEIGQDLDGIFDCKSPLWQFFQADGWMKKYSEAIFKDRRP